MNEKPRLFTTGRSLAAAAALLLSSALASHAQTTVLYNAATTTANPQTGAVHYLQQLTLAQGSGTYTLYSFQLGVNFNTGSTDQGVIVSFYTGLDLSPSSSDALASAVDVGDIGGTLGAPGSSGNFTYTFTLNNPISLPSNVLGVEITLTDDSFSAYSTEMNGRFTASAPTVGTSPGFVWNDADLDGTFTGAEQTKFSMANANIRFSMTGSAPIPEPSTWAMIAAGSVLLLALGRRRLA